MHIKGIDEFRRRLPSYTGYRILLIPLLSLISFFLGSIFLFSIYSVLGDSLGSDIFFYLEPFFPIFGQILITLVGFYLISRVWSRKEKLLMKDRETAYQRGVLSGFIGIPLILSVVFHNYLLNFIQLNQRNQLSLSLSSPLIIPNLVLDSFILLLRGFSGLFFLLLGTLTIRKALITFGLDYMGVVYLYYPEDSTLQSHRIYSILRHPTYLAIILISIGGCLSRFSIFSFITVIIILIGLYVHIEFVEEKELIQRFGSSYMDYKKQTPAILPRQITQFLKFLFIK